MIHLEPEQQELLSRFVEADRKIPKGLEREFLALEDDMFGASFVHVGGEDIAVEGSLTDAKILAHNGLLGISYASRGGLHFHVTPKGIQYYRDLKQGVRPAEVTAAGLPAPVDRKQLALEEILGKIAPRVLTIMNAACSPRDIEALRNEMGRLHERINELAVLFASEPDTQRYIRAIGQLGGGAVSIAPKVPAQLFESFSEATEALNRVLAGLQVKHAADNKTETISHDLNPVQPVTLLPGTRWEDIAIMFLDGNNVRITAKDRTWETDYKQMGFEKGRSRPRVPNKQWNLLEDLAEKHGQVSWDDGQADLKIKKRKHLLSKSLQSYFGISADPFHSYRTVKAYKIRIKLIPPSGSS